MFAKLCKTGMRRDPPMAAPAHCLPRFGFMRMWEGGIERMPLACWGVLVSTRETARCPVYITQQQGHESHSLPTPFLSPPPSLVFPV